MSRRAFILIIALVLFVGLAAVLGVYALRGSGTDTANNLAGDVVAQTDAGTTDGTTNPVAGEGQTVPPPVPTPERRLETVIITSLYLPAGTRITEDMLETEERPNDNIALQGGYVFSGEDMESVVGRIARVNIPRGQAILQPMLALEPSDILSFGSDFSLYLEQGELAVALPINQYSGLAYAMRAGDKVDVMMSIDLIKIDEEFNTALPNIVGIYNEEFISGGEGAFFTNQWLLGRLELIPALDIVGNIVPGQAIESADGSPLFQAPRRVTQLIIQQANVVAVGTPIDAQQAAINQARDLTGVDLSGSFDSLDQSTGEGLDLGLDVAGEGNDVIGVGDALDGTVPEPTSEPVPIRAQLFPDIIILSMSPQDALVLKWALEVGADIDLALRAQGDDQLFVTSSISLPTLVDQGNLPFPQPFNWSLEPAYDDLKRPSVPTSP